MDYKFYRVVAFEITGSYQLRVFFDDGSSQSIDFKDILAGEMYGPLRDLKLFNQVGIDKDTHTLVWPNGADFNPATLHDWNANLAEIKAAVAQWEAVPA